MSRRSVLLCATAVHCAAAILAASASAATREELVKRYHLDPKAKQIGGETLKVIRAHNSDPILKKYDLDNNGSLEGPELKALIKATTAKYSSPPWEQKPEPGDAADIAKRGAEAAQAEAGIPIEAIIDPVKPKKVSTCDDAQQLFVRRDKLDNYMFNLAKTQGASIAYLADWQSANTTFSVDGTVSYALWRKPCVTAPDDRSKPYLGAYAFAPWVSAHGERSTGGKDEQSDLRIGAETQVELTNGFLFDNQYLAASPYYQTDFRGEANAYGVEASWTPYWLNAGLGGNTSGLFDAVDWYWQFQAQADYLSVQDVGLTSLKDNDYAWLGFTTKLHVSPFKDSETLRDRIQITGTAQYYWDAMSGKSINDLLAEVSYNLDESGSTALSLNYEKGTRKETLKKVDQVSLKLDYKY